MSKTTEKRIAGKYEYRLSKLEAIASFIPTGRKLVAEEKPPTGTTLQYREREDRDGVAVTRRWRKLNIYHKAPNDPTFRAPENIIAIIEQYEAQKRNPQKGN